MNLQAQSPFLQKHESINIRNQHRNKIQQLTPSSQQNHDNWKITCRRSKLILLAKTLFHRNFFSANEQNSHIPNIRNQTLINTSEKKTIFRKITVQKTSIYQYISINTQYHQGTEKLMPLNCY